MKQAFIIKLLLFVCILGGTVIYMPYVKFVIVALVYTEHEHGNKNGTLYKLEDIYHYMKDCPSFASVNTETEKILLAKEIVSQIQDEQVKIRIEFTHIEKDYHFVGFEFRTKYANKDKYDMICSYGSSVSTNYKETLDDLKSAIAFAKREMH